MRHGVRHLLVTGLLIPACLLSGGCGTDIWMKKISPVDKQESPAPTASSAKPIAAPEIAEADPATLDTPIRQHAFNFAVRSWPPSRVYYGNGAVKHPILYLAGPYEARGSRDGYFRTMDSDSLLSVLISPTAYIANIALLPITLVFTPPWQMQQSRAGQIVLEPRHEIPAICSQMTAKQYHRHERGEP